MEDYLYYYSAVVKKNYDGDTITLDIDLGFGVWLKDQSIRLIGVDCPEIRGDERENGLKAKLFVENITKGKTLTIQTDRDKTGKYGRWLAKIYLPDGSNLSDLLIKEGYAVPYQSK